MIRTGSFCLFNSEPLTLFYCVIVQRIPDNRRGSSYWGSYLIAINARHVIDRAGANFNGWDNPTIIAPTALSTSACSGITPSAAAPFATGGK